MAVTFQWCERVCLDVIDGTDRRFGGRPAPA
jgi:hypothetical protein